VSSIPLPERPSRLKALVFNKLNLSAFGVLVVFIVCVIYLMTSVLNVGVPLISSAKTVKVQLPSTGGVYVGAPVGYRGVTVGRVTDIAFTATGVEASARIDSGTDIPQDTKVVVKSLSPVGEQYLDFEPETQDGPYLQDGAVVPGTSVDVPRTLASTVISVNHLLDQIDAKQLQTILDESNKALSGTAADLGRLADQGTQLVDDINAHWGNIDHVLTNSATLLDIGTEYGGQIVQAANDFKSFSHWLKGYTPTLVKTLNNAPTSIAQLQSLLDDAQSTVPTFLDVSSQVLGLLASYNPHLQTLLKNFAPGLGTLGDAVRNGALNMSLIIQSDNLCKYGTPELDPAKLSNRPLQPNGHCPASFKYLQRGAAHAPGPVR